MSCMLYIVLLEHDTIFARSYKIRYTSISFHIIVGKVKFKSDTINSGLAIFDGVIDSKVYMLLRHHSSDIDLTYMYN